MKPLLFLSIVLPYLVLTACAGGNISSQPSGENVAQPVEDQSTKPLAIKADQTGRAASQAPQDPGGKKPVTIQASAKPARPKKVEQAKPTADSPKRQPQDPIYVSLAPPVLDERMQQAEIPKGVVTEQIRGEFKVDPVIILVKSWRSEATSEQPAVIPSIADVEVSPKVSIKEVVEMNRKTGKPDKTMAVVYEATITSQVPPRHLHRVRERPCPEKNGGFEAIRPTAQARHRRKDRSQDPRALASLPPSQHTCSWR